MLSQHNLIGDGDDDDADGEVKKIEKHQPKNNIISLDVFIIKQ
jgi:hypothetical protein